MQSHRFIAVRKALSAIALSLVVLTTVFAPAKAGEVRLGKNVRIGGHDFSNQTYDSKRRARIYLYNGKPREEGCVWRKDGHGGRVKVCHLQRK
ncbi:hypothetical protein [Rhizobium sp. No.120]